MIKLRGLERRYPLGKEKFFYVLRDINLDMAEGEFVSVMGPSGAGKSTLLHILGMHDHGWEGEYSLNDTAVHHLKPKERATLRNEQIGFVFQQYHLLDDLTVYENLEIPLSYRRYSKSERAAMVADMLDRFHIDPFAALLVSTLEKKSDVDVVRVDPTHLHSVHMRCIWRAKVRDIDESKVDQAAREIHLVRF